VTNRRRKRSDESIFPTTILLATDGSKEAGLAATTAADLSRRTDSELHMIHLAEVPLVYHRKRHGGYHIDYEKAETQTRELLEGQVEKMEEAGVTMAQAHLKMGLLAYAELGGSWRLSARTRDRDHSNTGSPSATLTPWNPGRRSEASESVEAQP
jgi:hypothetical protein